MDARSNTALPPRQDLPRAGGFPAVEFKRNVPKVQFN